MENKVQNLRNRIKQLRYDCEKEKDKSDSFAYLPDIIEILDVFDEILAEGNSYPRHDLTERKKIVGGFVRIVTESYGFSEGRLGSQLLDLGEAFIKQNT